MRARPWILCAMLFGLLACTAGCMADSVVYVDEQGNELAVDESGQPLIPGRGFASDMPPPVLVDFPPDVPADAPSEFPDDMPTELTFDAPAQPTLPPSGSAGAAASAPRAPAAGPSPRAPAAVPAPDPNWNVPSSSGRTPAGAPRLPASTRPPAQPAKKINTSAGLDRPPAG